MAGSGWKRICTFTKCKCLFISPGMMEMPAKRVKMWKNSRTPSNHHRVPLTCLLEFNYTNTLNSVAACAQSERGR